jgi:hypothetical protein
MNNPDDYFPEINVPFLKNFVRYQIIKKKFDSLPLKKVVLYRYFSKHFPDVARKYVISFELGINRNKLKAALASLSKDQRKKNGDLVGLRRQTILDKDYLHHYWSLDDSFRAVYRNGPTRKDFLIEWFLLVKLPNEEMPLGVKFDQPHATLYDSSGKPSRRTRNNELHEVIWAAYLALEKRHSNEPTEGELWLELDREVGRDLKKYDKEEIIQEIKNNTIYWIDASSREKTLTKGSFSTILSRIKKKRKK